MPSSRNKPESRAVIDEILEWAQTGLGWGSNINSVVPIPAYGLIAPVLSALIKQIAAARTNKRDAAEVLIKIQTLANIIGESRKELVGRIEPLSTADQQTVHGGLSKKPSFQDPFDEFLKDLRQLETLSEGLKHDFYLSRVVFSSKDAGIIKQIQVGVLNATEFFQTRCLVETREYLTVINNKVEEIRATVKDIETSQRKEADDRLLESLPHVDAGYRASTNAIKGGFLEGTRNALFAELDGWIDGGSSAKPVCILSGGAGTGKSTVASELAKRLSNQGKLGASFFFDRGVADLNSTKMFFSTIAYQLANWTKGTLRQPIVDAAREHLTQGKSQAMQYEASALFHGPLKHANKESPVFVVIDALDECTQDASKLMPEMLDSLIAATRDGPLRIFLTSRPDQLVEYKLQSSQSIHTISIGTFSNSASNDIATFINVRFRQIPRGPEFCRSCPKVERRLARRAQGLFIYARTAMDFLETYPGTLEGGVSLLLSSKEGVALEALDQLYLTVLTNAFPPAHMKSSALRAHVQLVLACIALPVNRMTPRILESLMSRTSTPITCEDLDSVLDRLRSVVICKRGAPDEVFRPMHATFPQFLIDVERCRDVYYLANPRRHHAHLAEACLRMVLSLDENVCNVDLPEAAQAQAREAAREVAVRWEAWKAAREVQEARLEALKATPEARLRALEATVEEDPGNSLKRLSKVCIF